MVVIINDTLGAYGGTHTLTERVCWWLSNNGYESAVICISDDNKEICDTIKAYGTRIYKINVSNELETKKVFDNYIGEEIIVVNYRMDLYLNLEFFKQKTSYKFRNIVYCVHYGTFLIGSTYPRLLKKVVNKKYGRMLQKLYNNNAVVMMDEDTSNKTRAYYPYNNMDNLSVIRLPLIVEKTNDSEAIISNGFKDNTIITAARAEFPYKGYLIGIIDEFVSIHDEFPETKLVIVTGGRDEDVNLIQKKISEKKPDVQQAITLKLWMEYNQLKDLIKNSKVYIGMGTTILDAALLYKPSIPVKYDTMDCLSDSFFCDNPGYVVATEKCREHSNKFLKKILCMSKEEYKECCLRNYKSAVDLYDIDKNLKALINTKTKDDGTIMSYRDYWFVKILDMARYLLKRNKDDRFDVKKVKHA